jgi:hypothetical protein
MHGTPLVGVRTLDIPRYMANTIGMIGRFYPMVMNGVD